MSGSEPKSQVQKICDEVGRKRIAEKLGLGKAAIGNAVRDGVFPPSWYMEVKQLCDVDGIDCPLEAFNFRSLSNEDAA